MITDEVRWWRYFQMMWGCIGLAVLEQHAKARAAGGAR